MLRKTDLKGYVPHNFIYVCGFLERQNYFISGCQAKGPQGTFGVMVTSCALSVALLYTVFSSVQSLSRVRLFATPWIEHARPPCSSPSPGVHSDSRPSSPWCHPAISSSVVSFSSCPQSLPASSEPFPMSQLFAWSVKTVCLWGLTLCELYLNKLDFKKGEVYNHPPVHKIMLFEF